MCDAVQKELEQLASWAQALATTTLDHREAILESVAGKAPRVPGAPSNKAQALLVFGQIEQKFQEVEGAIDRCRRAISAEG